jgi:hypothetical protein
MGNSDSKLKNDPGLFGVIFNDTARGPGELLAMIQAHQGQETWQLDRKHRGM